MGGVVAPSSFFVQCQRRHPELPKIPTYLPTYLGMVSKNLRNTPPEGPSGGGGGGGVCLKAWKIQPQAGKGRLPEGRVVLL